MRTLFTYGIFSALLTTGAIILTSCSKEDSPASPTGPAETSFKSDVMPIFQANGCVGCHGTNGGLVVGSVASLLKGGLHGPAVTAGDADGSLLVRKISPNPPFGKQMPADRTPLTDSEISVIRSWISAGAKNN